MAELTLRDIVLSAFNYQKNLSADEIILLIETDHGRVISRQQVMNTICFLRKTGCNIISNGPRSDRRYTFIKENNILPPPPPVVILDPQPSQKTEISLLERIRHYVIALRIVTLDQLIDTFDDGDDDIVGAWTMAAVAEAYKDVREEYKLSIHNPDLVGADIERIRATNPLVRRCLFLTLALHSCSITDVSDLLGLSITEARGVMVDTKREYGFILDLTHRLLAV